MNRRLFLAAALAAIPAAGTLGGCATVAQNIDSTLKRIVDDTDTLAKGLSALVPSLSSVAGLSSETQALISATVLNVQTVADQVGAVSSVASAKPLVEKIETYVNTIVGALAALGPALPTPVSTILQAASILLPIIEIAVGIAVPAAAAKPGLDADWARGYLKAITPPR